MTRTRMIVVGATACMFSVAPAASVFAQESATPTTLDVQTSVVERDVTVQTVTSEEVDTDDDDDDSDKTGLWGLLGLLGLAGLAGLKRKRDDTGPTTSRTVPADTTPRGSTTTH